MNVHDTLKSSSVEEIKDIYAKNACSAAIGMTHVSMDFNLGNVIRSANFFGFGEVYYIGGKKGYDRRSTVGTHHYIPTHFIKTDDDFLIAINERYSLVCIENNIDDFSHKTVLIFEEQIFDHLPLPPLFLFGEEQLGISKDLLKKCEFIITIPSFGTVRSLNVGSCAAIVMAMYRQRYMGFT